MISFNNIGYYGKLGNQLFQYAALYGIAKKNGYEFSIPYKNSATWDNTHGYPSRLFLNEIFAITAKDSSLSEPNTKIIPCFSTAFENAIMNIQDNVDIVGYFQSQKYFEHCEEDLRKEFRFKNESLLNLSEQFISDIPGVKICLHIRRGDAIPLSGIGNPSLLENYCKKSVNYIEEILNKKCSIVVFSDDIEWCKSILPLWFSKHDLYFDKCTKTDENSYFVDQEISLMRMSLCNHFILASSSFSWWASWLSSFNDKIIVAPSKWYSDKPFESYKDIYMKGCVIL